MSAVMDEVAVHDSLCANCATGVSGKFCHACGQRTHLHKSLLHLGEEIVHGLLHFDAKGIRTLPMLIAYPGELTRRYVDGQRTRFVSLLGLFLFMVFLVFFVGALTSSPSEPSDPKAKMERRLAKAGDKVAKAEQQVARERAAGKDVTDAQESLDEARLALSTMSDAGAQLEEKTAKLKDGTKTTGSAWLDKALVHLDQNRELAVYKAKSTGAKLSFLLVPISLPFIWLLFCRRRDLTLYDHAVFSLYSLSFMSLLCAVLFVLNYLDWDTLCGWLFVLAPPIHMYRQLRGTYGIGRWSAVWRTWALMLVSLVVMIAYVIIIVGLSM